MLARAQAAFFDHRALNGWPLFWLLSLGLSAATAFKMARLDLADPENVSSMIAYSVRWAVPFIFTVTAASALPVLFPGNGSRWLLRNRRYVGLSFAVAMAWQGAFIFLMSAFFRDYYYADVYLLRDEIEGSSGYLFLLAMTVTSFQFGRALVSGRQWKTLHRCGMYFLWAYAFSVYWWNLFYYANATPIDYVYYWLGFAAMALRIAAWGSRRRQRLHATHGVSPPAGPLRGFGGGLIAVGLLAAPTGASWREPVSALLLSPSWSASAELWFPFWPFEPFLPLLVMALGTLIWTHPPGAAVAAGAPRTETS